MRAQTPRRGETSARNRRRLLTQLLALTAGGPWRRLRRIMWPDARLVALLEAQQTQAAVLGAKPGAAADEVAHPRQLSTRTRRTARAKIIDNGGTGQCPEFGSCNMSG